MTARIVLSCDGDWSGFPCRGALPVDTDNLAVAFVQAEDAGWSLDVDGDLCPAHARHREGTAT